MNDKNLKIKGLNIIHLSFNKRKNYLIINDSDDANLHYDPERYDVEIEMDMMEFFNLVMDQINHDPMHFLKLFKNFMIGEPDGTQEVLPEKETAQQQEDKMQDA